MGVLRVPRFSLGFLICVDLIFGNSVNEVRCFTDKASKIFDDSIPFKMPVWIMLIITAWFEAPELERLPKVIFLMMIFGLNCSSRVIISWRSRGLSRKVNNF
ncbi:MAG: hypothetical protein ACTSQE_16995 [Candidatus Heimdallarchaeaceae archaeon]